MSPRASQTVHARTRGPVADRTTRATPALPALARTACRLIYQHRILRTDQLQTLLVPHADGSYLRRCLRAAKTAGLVDAVSGPARQRAWFLTRTGYTVVEASGDVQIRTHRMTRALAAGGLLAHRLAVVDTGAAFVAAAAATNDVCTPFSWTPEVLLRPGRRRGDALIADAVLHYERHTAASSLPPSVWLLEVDRGTYPAARLATKVATYVDWWRTEPARTAYRNARLLIVFDLDDRPAARRTAALVDALARHPALARRRYYRLPAGATSLSALTARGPFTGAVIDVFDKHQPPVGAAGQTPGPASQPAGLRGPLATPTTVALPPGW